MTGEESDVFISIETAVPLIKLPYCLNEDPLLTSVHNREPTKKKRYRRLDKQRKGERPSATETQIYVIEENPYFV